MRRRAEQVVWVLELQRDLNADFRAIYHLTPDEALDLDGPEYLALAFRAPAYRGSVAAVVAREQQKQDKNAAQVADEHSPMLSDFFEFG